MNFKFKKAVSMILLIFISCIIVSCSNTVSSVNYNIDNKIEETAYFMKSTIQNPVIASIGGDWTVMSLARADIGIEPEYFENYYRNVVATVKENNGVLHERKYTEYSRVILALTAIGKDPTDVAGYNLVESLADYEKVIFQGHLLCWH